ncbi:MAG: hypothetical protein ACKO47_00170 [Alphaproteobacteria bacterium]
MKNQAQQEARQEARQEAQQEAQQVSSPKSPSSIQKGSLEEYEIDMLLASGEAKKPLKRKHEPDTSQPSDKLFKKLKTFSKKLLGPSVISPKPINPIKNDLSKKIDSLQLKSSTQKSQGY